MESSDSESSESSDDYNRFDTFSDYNENKEKDNFYHPTDADLKPAISDEYCPSDIEVVFEEEVETGESGSIE